MRIERIDVRGFKQLTGEWELSPSLTVVSGPNEAGKSTLQEFLVRVVFGFSKHERRRSGGLSKKDLRRPWSGAPFAVNARLGEARGTDLAVEWDFETHTVTVRDANTGEDLSASVRGKREDVSLGDFALGLGLDEFRDVCCLHQEAIAAVTKTEPLILALRRSVEAGAGDVGVDDADRRLSDFLRDEIGVHAGHYGELSGRTLATARSDRRALVGQVETAERQRAEIAELAVEKERKVRKAQGVAKDLATVRQQFLFTELGALESRLEEARQQQAAAASQPVDPVKLPQSAIQAVRSREDAVERLEEQIATRETEAQLGAGRLGELKQQRNEVVASIDALSMYAEIDADREDEVHSGLARIQPPVEEIPPPPQVPERDSQLEHFRQERGSLAELAPFSAGRSAKPAG